MEKRCKKGAEKKKCPGTMGNVAVVSCGGCHGARQTRKKNERKKNHAAHAYGRKKPGAGKDAIALQKLKPSGKSKDERDTLDVGTAPRILTGKIGGWPSPGEPPENPGNERRKATKGVCQQKNVAGCSTTRGNERSSKREGQQSAIGFLSTTPFGSDEKARAEQKKGAHKKIPLTMGKCCEGGGCSCPEQPRQADGTGKEGENLKLG